MNPDLIVHAIDSTGRKVPDDSAATLFYQWCSWCHSTVWCVFSAGLIAQWYQGISVIWVKWRGVERWELQRRPTKRAFMLRLKLMFIFPSSKDEVLWFRGDFICNSELNLSRNRSTTTGLCSLQVFTAFCGLLHHFFMSSGRSLQQNEVLHS